VWESSYFSEGDRASALPFKFTREIKKVTGIEHAILGNFFYFPQMGSKGTTITSMESSINRDYSDFN
jgi:hypothetical protein